MRRGKRRGIVSACLAIPGVGPGRLVRRRPLAHVLMPCLTSVLLLCGVILPQAHPVAYGPVRPALRTVRPSPVVRSVPIRAGCIGVDDPLDRVFVSGVKWAGPFVSMLDARSGAILRTAALSGTGCLVVAVSLQRVFVLRSTRPAGGAAVTVLDAHDLHPLGTVPVPGDAQDIAISPRTDHVFVLADGPASVARSPAAGFLSTLDARTGRLLHTVRVPDPTFGSLTVADQAQRVFVTSWAEGGVTMLDAASGRLLTRIATGGSATLMAVDGRHERVYVNTVGGLVVLDAPSGRVLHTITMTADIDGVTVAEPAERVFVTVPGPIGFGGEVEVFDARSGRMRRRVPVTPGSTTTEPVGAIANPLVDERANRVYTLLRSPQPDQQSGPSGPGALMVLDAPTGTVLQRHIPLPDTATEGPFFYARLFLAQRAHRLFVIADTTVTVLDTARL